jgi:hypothetical protein
MNLVLSVLGGWRQKHSEREEKRKRKRKKRERLKQESDQVSVVHYKHLWTVRI